MCMVGEGHRDVGRDLGELLRLRDCRGIDALLPCLLDGALEQDEVVVVLQAVADRLEANGQLRR